MLKMLRSSLEISQVKAEHVKGLRVAKYRNFYQYAFHRSLGPRGKVVHMSNLYAPICACVCTQLPNA